MKVMEYVATYAEGICGHCNKRAERDGEWARCRCCGRRWRYHADAQGFALEFDDGGYIVGSPDKQPTLREEEARHAQ